MLFAKAYYFACGSERVNGANFWIAKDATFFHADNEDSDQTAQNDLTLRWAHISDGTFSHAVTCFIVTAYLDISFVMCWLW